MELMLWIILVYGGLILGGGLVAYVAVYYVPRQYLRLARQLVARFGRKGWLIIGASGAAMVLGYLLEPPVLRKGLVPGQPGLNWRISWGETFFSLFLEPPVFLFAAILGSLAVFALVLRR